MIDSDRMNLVRQVVETNSKDDKVSKNKLLQHNEELPTFYRDTSDGCQSC